MITPLPNPLSPKDTLCSEDEFAELLEEMVADEAPRLFAVVHEYGERVDGRIAAWGMAFPDHAEVVAVGQELRVSLNAPETALRLFERRANVRARLVWFNPGAATAVEDEE